jgi:NDP-sugar pyrophosphorylase family protein
VITRSLPPAAVLAGGLGTRIRAVGGSTPKVLLPVEGRPFIGHLLDVLIRQGVSRAVLCLGHAADAVWDAAQTEAGDAIELVASRESEPLGTGGALRNALPHLPGIFFALNGDTLLDAPLAELLEQHRARGAALTLSLVRSHREAEKGSVRMAPDGTVLRFDEKIEDGTGLINAGVYVMDAGVIPPGAGPVSLEREIIPAALERGDAVTARIVDAPFVDIGLPEDYLAVRNRLPRR